MNEKNKENCVRYYGMALDPIHIGTGGYRLGRVDNTIVREPATNLPKIPGTTLEGCARTYAYYEELEKTKINKACAVGKEVEDKKGNKIKPCGRCKICLTFGFTGADGEIESLHGMAQFSDARILFFPVYSMIGPVWITCPSILKDAFGEEIKVSPDKIKTTFDCPDNKLNLGWLYLEKEEELKIDADKLKPIPKEIQEKLVLVSNEIFSHIVNSNLEVRTSVAIDPETGAAEERALFTYEAIPRATIFYFDVMYLNPDLYDAKILKDNKLEKISIDEIKETIKQGLKLFEMLGIGGMGTRGFGRIRILNLEGG